MNVEIVRKSLWPVAHTIHQTFARSFVRSFARSFARKYPKWFKTHLYYWKVWWTVWLCAGCERLLISKFVECKCHQNVEIFLSIILLIFSLNLFVSTLVEPFLSICCANADHCDAIYFICHNVFKINSKRIEINRNVQWESEWIVNEWMNKKTVCYIYIFAFVSNKMNLSKSLMSMVTSTMVYTSNRNMAKRSN